VTTYVPNSTTLTVLWRKSSRSGANGDCVELAAADGAVYVRDSKNPEGPALRLSRQAHDSLIAAAKAGEFDFGLI
jgi:hypothetical protein